MKKIYVAGPLGFSEAGRHFLYNRLIPEIQSLGFEVIDPWKSPAAEKMKKILEQPSGNRLDVLKAVNEQIAEACKVKIDESDGMIAVLDGTDVDSGTSAEIAYAYAKGKSVIGYRGDFRISSDNEAAVVNVMIEYFIAKSGGLIIRELSELKKEMLRVFGN